MISYLPHRVLTSFASDREIFYCHSDLITKPSDHTSDLKDTEFFSMFFSSYQHIYLIQLIVSAPGTILCLQYKGDMTFIVNVLSFPTSESLMTNSNTNYLLLYREK